MLTSPVAATVAFALARGVSMRQITEVTGLAMTDLVDPAAQLSHEHMPVLWRLLAARCPGEAIALQMAEATPFSFLGPLAYAARYADRLRDVLDLLVRYRAVLSSELSMTLLERGDETMLRSAHPLDGEDDGHAAELGLGVGVRFLRQLVPGTQLLTRVEFTHAAHGPIERYRAFFGVPVRFQQPSNALVMLTSTLAQPMATPDEHLFLYIQHQLDQARARLPHDDGPAEVRQVRAAVAHNAERCQYSAEALARAVGMSLRSLQRMLSAHALTVRQLLDEAREANARQLLADRNLSIEQIAFLLDYSAESAFRRAFKRWTGQSPAGFRRAATSR